MSCDSEVIVVDCLTIFAANLLEAEGEDSEAIERRVEALCAALQTSSMQRCAGVERGWEWSGSGVSAGAEIPRSAGRDQSESRQSCR